MANKNNQHKPAKKQRVRAKDRREAQKQAQLERLAKDAKLKAKQAETQTTRKLSENKPAKKKKIRAKDRRESIAGRGLNIAKQAVRNEVDDFKSKSTLEKGLKIADLALRGMELYEGGASFRTLSKAEGVSGAVKKVLKDERDVFNDKTKREKLDYVYKKGKKVNKYAKKVERLDAQAKGTRKGRVKADEKPAFEDSELIRARKARAAYNKERLERERQVEARKKRKAIEKEKVELNKMDKLTPDVRKALDKEINKAKREEKLRTNYRTGTVSYNFAGLEFSVKAPTKSAREVLENEAYNEAKKLQNNLRVEDVGTAQLGFKVGSKIAKRMGYAEVAANMSQLANKLGPWGVVLSIGLEVATYFINEYTEQKEKEEQEELEQGTLVFDDRDFANENIDTVLDDIEYMQDEIEALDKEYEELEKADVEAEVEEEAIQQEEVREEETQEEVQEEQVVEEVEEEIAQEEEEEEDDEYNLDDVIEINTDNEELDEELAKERSRMAEKLYNPDGNYFELLVAEIASLADMNESNLTFVRFKYKLEVGSLPEHTDPFWKYALDNIDLPSSFAYDSDGRGSGGMLVGYETILEDLYVLYDEYERKDIEYITPDEYMYWLEENNLY